MEPLNREEVELYSSHIFKKPKTSWTNWIAYTLTALVLVFMFMFLSLFSCIADSSKPTSVCRDSLAGQTLSIVLSKIF